MKYITTLKFNDTRAWIGSFLTFFLLSFLVAPLLSTSTTNLVENTSNILINKNTSALPSVKCIYINACAVIAVICPRLG